MNKSTTHDIISKVHVYAKYMSSERYDILMADGNATEDHEDNKKPMLSERFIQHLIDTPKEIMKDKKKAFELRVDNTHYRVTVQLECRYVMQMFLRKNLQNPMDFSIVLRYTNDKKQNYTIVRYNGDHGGHRDPWSHEFTPGPHIHRITERGQRDCLKEECYAERTDKYKTFTEAREAFIRDMSITYKGLKNNTKLSDEW
jgi:hypothetical protein